MLLNVAFCIVARWISSLARYMVVMRALHVRERKGIVKYFCRYICDFMLLNVVFASLLDGCRAWTNLWQLMRARSRKEGIVNNLLVY